MLLTKINRCYTTKALQVFVILFCTLIFISCKKEVLSPDNDQKKISNEFRERLYVELLKKDETRRLLSNLAPSEKLDWEKTLFRISSHRSQPFNYELPIVSNDGNCKRIIEFSFSKDKELVDIRLREFNKELSKQNNVGNSLTENERTNNILHFLSKSGLKIDPAITGAKGEKVIDTKSPAKTSNTTSALPTKSSHATPDKYAELKPSNSVQYTYPKPPMPDTVHCATTVDYDFYFNFGTTVPESQALEIMSTLSYFFFQNLNARGLPYGDDVMYQNQIHFFNNYSPVDQLENVIRDCIYYAVQSTQGHYGYYLWASGIQYMNISSWSSCVTTPVIDWGEPTDENLEVTQEGDEESLNGETFIDKRFVWTFHRAYNEGFWLNSYEKARLKRDGVNNNWQFVSFTHLNQYPVGMVAGREIEIVMIDSPVEMTPNRAKVSLWYKIHRIGSGFGTTLPLYSTDYEKSKEFFPHQ